jgi:biopolymer transport protein ExbB/TolQ
MERAYELRDAREKSRQEYVQKRLDDQWRDSCDDARTLDSKAMVKFLNQERLRQIQDKVDRNQKLSSQENSFLEEWNRQLEELAKRDKEKNEYRRRIDKETSDAVRAQIETNSKTKEQFYMTLLKEDEDELAKVSLSCIFMSCYLTPYLFSFS